VDVYPAGVEYAPVTQRQRKLQVAWGRALRKFRTNAGISQEKLADMAGMNRSYVGDVERGQRNISLANMDQLARALGKPLSELMKVVEGFLGGKE
jgi:transcriptional regulator with XRE-family HTH domain